MRRLRTIACPDCVRVVPRGGWCNWCGAPLALSATSSRPRGGPWGRLAVVGSGVVAIVAVATTILSADSGPSSPVVAAEVVLAEDPPAVPPPPSPVRAPTTGPHVDVICSDLRRRSVPEELVGAAEPGTLAELSWGPCVVMGPEGVAVP